MTPALKKSALLAFVALLGLAMPAVAQDAADEPTNDETLLPDPGGDQQQLDNNGQPIPLGDDVQTPDDNGQDEALPAPDATDQGQTDAGGEGEAQDGAPAPTDENAVLPPPDDQQLDATAPQVEPPPDDAMLPPADDQAAAPADDAAIPAPPDGQVLVTIRNSSPAPVDVFVEPEGGGTPILIMKLDPEFEAVQPTPPGRTWRMAQNNTWLGGFVSGEEPQQLFTFTGEAP
jgi:hypothetical protein